ncbi:hypothetical protein [Taibaiella soli]|uniref:HEXXH motif domain-containing protein n=1 Tax=Taibaiella soli TaxID=1649169 RepID=A0A2W2BJF0_9BACT|nr:hypothetical protein [Taibaiella soli]PZF73566.1 hypothetical protein DN068_07540 [Taibaiella soli]
MNAYLEFAKSLEWKNDVSLFICEEYQSFLLGKINAVISSQDEISEELKSLLDQMDETEFHSFIRIPFVAKLFYGNLKNEENTKLRLLEYAFSYLSWLNKLPSKYDFKNIPADGLRRANNSMPLEQRVNYPLPLSAKSSIKIPGMNRGGNDLCMLSFNTLETELSKITSICQRISELSEKTWELVAIGTECLVLRTEMTEHDRFSSASFRGLAGLNLIINSHATSVEVIMDAIIHEAIHSVLYQLEPTHGAFFIDDTTSAALVQSPWTSNTINTDNLAQACFVWYGLFNFWSKVIIDSDDVNEISFGKYNVNKISNGFRKLSLMPFNNHLNTDMKKAILYMVSMFYGK